MNRLKQLLSISILLVLPVGLNAQLKRFQHVDWKVKVDSGLRNGFQVTMQLTDAKGKITEVDYQNQGFYWQSFRFVSDYPIAITNGVGFYKQLHNFEKVDSIRVEAICQNEKLNSVFYVPVKYCTGLDFVADSLSFDGTPSSGWMMVMNTKERFPLDENWVDFSQLQKVSDSRLEVTAAGIKVKSKDPFLTAHVRLVDPNSSRLVFDKDFVISYPDRIKMDFSGKSGRRGQNGQKGTMPGESGDNGEDGEDGTAGEDVTLFIEPIVIDNVSLLVIHSVSGKRWKDYHVMANPLPQLIVDASGGNGGDGGDGGSGANATINPESDSRNRGGAGGNGGYGGHAGEGGYVEVILLTGTPFDEDKLTVDVSAGLSGREGKPGSGGRNETGILEALLTDGKQQSGYVGIGGSEARNGSFRGVRVVNETVFRELMQQRGW